MENHLRIAICEDLDTDATLLLGLIKKSSFPCECGMFSSGEELLHSFAAGRYDLVFMDIYMEGMRGVETVEAIRETDEHVVIAFTTTSRDHALESYRLGALKYLEKPVTFEGVKETLELAMMMRKPLATVKILIGGKHLEIPLDDIYYFEQRNHIVELHTSSGVLKTSQTVRMDDIEKQLSSPPFVRCHHSFIVNLRYVWRIDTDYKFFVITNGERVHIRHNLIKKMKNTYEDYMFAVTRSDKV